MTPAALASQIRVLFLNDTARNGGPGRSLFTILRFLDPSRVHRAVVLPRPGVIAELLRPVADEMIFEPRLVENPVEPWSRAIERTDFDAPAPLRALRLAGNVARAGLGLRRLSALIKKGRYDLVYCNGTNADFAGGALSWMTGVPSLWHVRYTSLPSAVRGVHDRLAAGLGVRRIVCVSHAAAALFPHVMSKVAVIHNALDLTAFDPAVVTGCLRSELGLGPDVVVFGSQGRILPRKGYVEMVRAAKIALDALAPNDRTKMRFVVLGDTPEDIGPDHLAECRALVRSLAIESSFAFLGFRDDVRPYVRDFNVAVVPSVYADPLPRAVIESMAFGMPVIAFDVGGVAEMLKDGETGALVTGAPPDVKGMADQILRYFRDPELCARQGRAARERISSEYDAKVHATRIEAEIRRATGHDVDRGAT
ncbi:N/A [soil metagenome]